MKHKAIRDEVARRSPKNFATIIRERNEELLVLLEQVYKKVMLEYDSNKECEFNICESVKIGCPHCGKVYPCSNCIWTDACVEKGEMDRNYSCCMVNFNNVAYRSLQNFRGRGFYVSYGHAKASVGFNWFKTNRKTAEAAYKRCKKFLEGHIEWADSPLWGEKCDN